MHMLAQWTSKELSDKSYHIIRVRLQAELELIVLSVVASEDRPPLSSFQTANATLCLMLRHNVSPSAAV